MGAGLINVLSLKLVPLSLSVFSLLLLPASNHIMFSPGNNSTSLLSFISLPFLSHVLYFPPHSIRCCELWSLASNCYLFLCQLDATPYGSGELKMEIVKINASPPSPFLSNPHVLKSACNNDALPKRGRWDLDHRPNPVSPSVSSNICRNLFLML